MHAPCWLQVDFGLVMDNDHSINTEGVPPSLCSACLLSEWIFHLCPFRSSIL